MLFWIYISLYNFMLLAIKIRSKLSKNDKNDGHPFITYYLFLVLSKLYFTIFKENLSIIFYN